MIDTDKYEGHTHQDQWYAEEDWKNMIGLKTEDALLTADAPLLLAEVKRLTQLNYEQRVEMQRLRDAYSSVASLVEQVWGTFND